MERILGIEVVRIIIMNEVNYIMFSYGMSIDIRYVMLLVDLMIFKVIWQLFKNDKFMFKQKLVKLF